MTEVTNYLRSLTEWSSLSVDFIETLSTELSTFVSGDFQWKGVTLSQASIPIASFTHQPSKIEFNLIPGGSYLLGLSDEEFEIIKKLPEADEELLNTLRPAKQIEIKPFLISQLPLLEEDVLKVIDIDWSVFRPDFQPLSGKETNKVPIYLTRAELETVLSYYSLSLPTESQWEYATRGGTRSPFFFGKSLPHDNELNKILATSFQKTKPETLNPFGISGMLVGGWCKDTFQRNRWHEKDEGSPYVIRGGAAIYWPWQNTGEWMLALSAMRRSSEELEDCTCSAHVIAPVSI